MRMRHRTLARSRGKLVMNSYNRMVAHFAYAQTSEKWGDWTFRTISQRQAENLVSAGEAERIIRRLDGEVQVVGYRALKPTSWERPSPATLTFATMKAVAKHAQGYRLTRGESEQVIKFRVWPLIGDTRAVAVRPRISDAERDSAETLLAGGKLQAA
jgi:hypothetical protein